MEPNTQNNEETKTQDLQQVDTLEQSVEQSTVQQEVEAQPVQAETQQSTVQNQQPVQQDQQESTATQQSNVQDKIKEMQKQFTKKKKTMFIIVAVVIVLIVGANFFSHKAKGSANNTLGGASGNEIVKIDTGKTWGDSFATYIQKFANELEEAKAKLKEDGKNVVEDREYEVTFVDFDFDSTPEMIVKYVDFSGVETYRFMRFANGEVSETKDFRNCTFKIIYSIKDKEAKWYIFISNDGKYGAYTLLEKIAKGTANNSDIKSSNDKEVAAYNARYASTDYKYTFYKLENNSFESDFKLAVDKFDENDKDIKSVKEKLINDYANATVDEDIIYYDPYIVLGDYILSFGDYASVVNIYENGEIVGTEKIMFSINRNGTVTIENEQTMGFFVYGKVFYLDNGMSLKVIGNNKFMYGTGEGFEYNYIE